MPSRSGSIQTANKSQKLADYNASRKSLKGQNTSSGDLWLNDTGNDAGVNLGDSYKVAPGATFSIEGVDAVNIFGAGAGASFVAVER